MTDLARKLFELELLTSQLEARVKRLESLSPPPAKSRHISKWPEAEAWAYLASYDPPKTGLKAPPPASPWPPNTLLSARAWNVMQRDLGLTSPAELLAFSDLARLRGHPNAGRPVIGEIARLRIALQEAKP